VKWVNISIRGVICGGVPEGMRLDHKMTEKEKRGRFWGKKG
jgi:hypothetical protein